MKLKLAIAVFGFVVASVVNVGEAATVIDLNEQSSVILKSFLPGNQRLAGSTPEVKITETSRSVDFNKTTHIRVMQTYSGLPVMGSEAIIHLPKDVKPSLNAAVDGRYANKVSMNGVIYRNMQADLKQTPAFVFNQSQADKALTAAIQQFRTSASAPFTISESKSTLQIYMDEQAKAHYVFVTSFIAHFAQGMPAIPTAILDAVTLTTYESWNDLKSANKIVAGGGIGGNGNMGKIIYDGDTDHRSALEFERDDVTSTCYLRNASVILRDARTNKVPSFRCEQPDASHNNVYWNTLNDEMNGGYSPNNDGIYSDKIVLEMYQKWFGIPMLVKNGKPMQVTFKVHNQTEKQNAYYLRGEMVFGEGDDESYPVVAPSVVAHEMSHGFTEQHSNLTYTRQSGGINESFSDMADKAVEFYAEGKNNWEIDPELLKEGGRILRYMDQPTKSCGNKSPGDDCPIEHFKDYNPSIDVHDLSGVYNKVFYLIASKWDTHKAFEVMTQANMNYWTARATFSTAACGVIKATRDYQYDEQTVRDAMQVVGVTIKKC